MFKVDFVFLILPTTFISTKKILFSINFVKKNKIRNINKWLKMIIFG